MPTSQVNVAAEVSQEFHIHKQYFMLEINLDLRMFITQTGDQPGSVATTARSTGCEPNLIQNDSATNFFFYRGRLHCSGMVKVSGLWKRTTHFFKDCCYRDETRRKCGKRGHLIVACRSDGQQTKTVDRLKRASMGESKSPETCLCVY